MIGALLSFFLIGLVALLVLGVVLAVVGTVFSIAAAIAGFLLFKVAPVVLVGYILVRLLAPRRKRLSAADREWLES
jgi:uncharacterized membrane protein